MSLRLIHVEFHLVRLHLLVIQLKQPESRRVGLDFIPEQHFNYTWQKMWHRTMNEIEPHLILHPRIISNPCQVGRSMGRTNCTVT